MYLEHYTYQKIKKVKYNGNKYRKINMIQVKLKIKIRIVTKISLKKVKNDNSYYK